MKKLNFLTQLFFGAFLIISAGGCSKEDDNDYIPTISISSEQREMVWNINGLGIKMLRTIAESTETNANIVISPMGISQLLGMEANALGEDAGERFIQTIGSGSYNLEEFNGFNKYIVDEFMKLKPEGAFGCRSEIYVNENDYGRLNPQYIDLISSSYFASINSSSDHDGISFENRVSFKSEWFNEIEKSSIEGSFYVSNDEEVGTEMVVFEKSAFTSHEYDNKIRFTTIPFAKKSFSIVFITPASIHTPVNSLFNIYTDDELGATIAGEGGYISHGNMNGTIAFPNLSFDFTTDLTEVLSGGTEALNYSSMFKGGDDSFQRGTTVQTTSVSFSKSGAEGNSESRETSRRNANGPVQALDLTFDRPFMFAIVEHSTGMILLCGRFGNPSK